MCTYTWGKIMFSEMPKVLNNFVFEESPIYFSKKKNELFISELLENEIYFNIALGQEWLVNISEFGGFLDGYCNYFYEGLSKKTVEYEYFRIVRKNVKRFERTIRAIMSIPGVIRMTLYHSYDDYGNSEDFYENVDWTIDEFTSKFHISMINNGMFPPDIKAVFVKPEGTE